MAVALEADAIDGCVNPALTCTKNLFHLVWHGRFALRAHHLVTGFLYQIESGRVAVSDNDAGGSQQMRAGCGTATDRSGASDVDC